MGRAITMENRQDDLDRRLKLVEDTLDELLQNGTRVHHVDLGANRTDDTRLEKNLVALEGKKKTKSKSKKKEPEVAEPLPPL